MNREKIGHNQKKTFRAKLFAILMDYSNDKIWSVADANVLNDLVQRYSKIDKCFVSCSIAHYQKITKQKLELALISARSKLI